MRFIFTRFRPVGLLLISFSLLLAACSDEATPTVPATATVTPESSVSTNATPQNAQPANPSTQPAANATPTATGDEIDPNVAYTPGTTVSTDIVGTPRPRFDNTPTPTPNFGALPVPPRTLVPRPTTPAATATTAKNAPSPTRPPLTPLPKGNFVVGTSNGLYLLSANGQDDRILASGTAFSNPKISPDGTRIAVFRTDPINLKQQFYLFTSGGDSKIIGTDGGTVLNYSWSPDSKNLALTRATDTNNDGQIDENDTANIWLYDVATGKQQQVAEGRNPAWSPDGVRLAFIISGTAPAQNDIDPTTHELRKSPNSIGVYNVQSNAKRTLVGSKGLDFALKDISDDPNLKNSSVSLRYFKEVSWHPDSKHITASADATGPNSLRTGLILTLTIDETNPKLVTAGGDAASRLLWSPDSKRLAFETEPQYPLKAKNGLAIGLLDNADPVKPAPTRLYVGDPATRNYTRSPLWINNGQQLAFLKGDNSMLATVDLDGKNEHLLISACNGFDWF